jgi:hypothetical protein
MMPPRKARFRWVPALGLVAALTAILLTAGCGLPRRYYAVEAGSIRDLPVLDRHLKRIGVCRFKGPTGADQAAVAARFENTLAAALGRNCGKVEVVEGRNDGAPDLLRRPPLFDNGRADNFALAQAARRMGFQILVQGGLLSLRHRIDRSGWARFRKSHHFLDLHLQAAAVNAVTAAKIAQHSEMITLPIDAETGTAIDTGNRFHLPELTEAVDEAGVDLALKLCAAIRSHPWQSVVREIRGDKMVPAAPPSAGLVAGDRLAVFDGGRVFTGNDGERFVLPGFRQGTLVVTSVSGTDGEVTGVGEDGAVFPVGSILVPVR